MKISTWNVNGLRSAVKNGFDEWLFISNNDFVCLQEVKIKEDLLTKIWFFPYELYLNAATKRGYSGVATLVKPNLIPLNITYGMQDIVTDTEGRILTTEFQSFILINVYAPHSHRKLLRLDIKRHFCKKFIEYIQALKNLNKPIIIVGDMNVAHQEIDLSNPAANKNNAGFLPEERQWMTSLLKTGFIDAFRIFCTDHGNYTWWSMREGVRERNIGWRLDYILVDKILADRVKACSHSPKQLGSDHCPVILDIDI